jgi:hypothetical protein
VGWVERWEGFWGRLTDHHTFEEEVDLGEGEGEERLDAEKVGQLHHLR